MAKVVTKAGVKREDGWLYFIDKNGDVARVPMARAGQKTSKKKEVVAKTGVKKESGNLYFLDKQGNVSCAPLQRGGKKKKAAKKR
jgi:hypothetical protein